MKDIHQDRSFASNYLGSKSRSDLSRTRSGSLTPSMSKASFDLLTQTFSAGSVDICQVVTSKEPPMVPLRMEMKCNGFETVRTKRDTLSKCLQKIEKAKKLLEEQRKQTAVSYSTYKKTHDDILSKRLQALDEIKTRNSMASIVSMASMTSATSMSSRSTRSSSKLLTQTFSIGSVDICQVIRSDRPPMVPMRMEVNCDGFETVRTKRKAINDCVKKIRDLRSSMSLDQEDEDNNEDEDKNENENEDENGVSYNAYIKAHNEIVASRKATIQALKREAMDRNKSEQALGTISEDQVTIQKEERDDQDTLLREELHYPDRLQQQTVSNQEKFIKKTMESQDSSMKEVIDERTSLKNDESTGKTVQLDSEWTFEYRRKRYAEERFVHYPGQGHHVSTQTSLLSDSSTRSTSSESCFRIQHDRKNQNVLFDDAGIPKDKTIIPNVNSSKQEKKKISEEDRYCITLENKPSKAIKKFPDKYDTVKGEEITNDFSNIKLVTTGELSSKGPYFTLGLLRDKRLYDDFSHSAVSSVKTMQSNDEMLSYSFDKDFGVCDDSDDEEGIQRNTKINSTEMGSSIPTESEYMTLANRAVITFDYSTSSCDGEGEAEIQLSHQAINTLCSSEDRATNIISLDSGEDSIGDRYKIIENENKYGEDRYESAEIKGLESTDYENTNQDNEPNMYENFFSDDDDEEANIEYIPIGEYNFHSSQYRNYSKDRDYYFLKEPEQYHYVDDRFMFSTLQQMDLNSSQARRKEVVGSHNYYLDPSWTNSLSFLQGNEKKNKKVRNKKKRSRKNKKPQTLGVHEIVFESEITS